MQQIRVFSEKNKPPYTGFIYVWRNSVTGKSYVGSHMGCIHDGYIGSGKHFQQAYRKTPELFKRRILEYVCGDIQKLIQKEDYWLSLFAKKPENHYNSAYKATGLHPLNYESKEAIKFTKLGRKWYNDGTNEFMLHVTDAVTRNYSLGRLSNKRKSKNKAQSGFIWVTNGFIEQKVYSVEDIPIDWYQGRTLAVISKCKLKICSNTTKEAIRIANIGIKKSDKAKEKMRQSKLNRKWYTNGKISRLYKDHPGYGWAPGRLPKPMME